MTRIVNTQPSKCKQKCHSVHDNRDYATEEYNLNILSCRLSASRLDRESLLESLSGLFNLRHDVPLTHCWGKVQQELGCSLIYLCNDKQGYEVNDNSLRSFLINNVKCNVYGDLHCEIGNNHLSYLSETRDHSNRPFGLVYWCRDRELKNKSINWNDKLSSLENDNQKWRNHSHDQVIMRHFVIPFVDLISHNGYEDIHLESDHKPTHKIEHDQEWSFYTKATFWNHHWKLQSIDTRLVNTLVETDYIFDSELLFKDFL